MEEAEPDAGRLTKDIDIVVRREDLQKIAAAVEPFGLEYRHAAGVDMLVRREQPSARRAVHLIFTLEKVRPSLPDLVRMKLTSFRSRDETHIKDLDEAGLITPEIEAGLSSVLRERLLQARARE